MFALNVTVVVSLVVIVTVTVLCVPNDFTLKKKLLSFIKKNRNTAIYFLFSPKIASPCHL